jgi:hypothetical protein
MRASIHGRVSATNLPKGKALLPLFEAVVTPIRRSKRQAVETIASALSLSVRAIWTMTSRGQSRHFTITDTGISFTAANFESFNTVDSLYKANLGGSTDPTRNPSNRLRDFRRRALLDYVLSACASFSQYSSTSGP